MADKWKLDGVKVDTSNNMTITGNLEAQGSVITIANLPTSDPSVAGQLWANTGVVTVSAG